MTNKIALVTGANKSIGLEVVRGLARLGMTVYLSSRDQEGGRAATADALQDGDVRYIHVDMTDDATMVAAIAAIEAAHGRLDVLVNNAGIGGNSMEPAILRRTLETNLLGPVRLIELARPLLKASGSARVVNVTSRAGQYDYIADPEKIKPFAYSLSKASLNAATALFAEALRADGVKVNAACPGYVYSKISAFMGTRTPQQGAEIILKLATLPDDGPSGQFFNESGRLPW
jgi:NAD(P)-dependent dehydrogenase (short-subunit alcohol dehydrogenase family)